MRWDYHERKRLTQDVPRLDVTGTASSVVRQSGWHGDYITIGPPDSESPQRVTIVAMASNLGRGYYYLAQCPDCGRRCRYLYCPLDTITSAWLCRNCWRLQYKSELKLDTLWDRDKRVARAIRESGLSVRRKVTLLTRRQRILDAIYATQRDMQQRDDHD